MRMLKEWPSSSDRGGGPPSRSGSGTGYGTRPVALRLMITGTPDPKSSRAVTPEPIPRANRWDVIGSGE